MKNSISKSIFFSVCLFNFIFLSAAQAKSEADQLKKANRVYKSVISDAINSDVEDFLRETHPIPSILRRLNDIYLETPGSGTLAAHAQRGPNWAIAALAIGKRYGGFNLEDPLFQSIAGFAMVPCNKEKVTRELAERYSTRGIDPKYQKPFQESEGGVWKKLPIPDDLKP